VFLGNGDGTFQSPVNYLDGGSDGYPAGLVVADFNGDGNLDLAEANYSTITVLLGNGDGSFRGPELFDAGAGLYSIAVGDFNGDGIADLVVGNDLGPIPANVLLGNGDGSFQLPQPTDSDGYLVAVADINGDGLADLITNGSTQLGNGNGTFQPPLVFTATLSGYQPDTIAVADFNGDGKADLVTSSVNFVSYVSVVSVAIGNGDGTFQEPINYVASGGAVAVQDFAKSGRADIALANLYEYGGEAVVLLSTPAVESFTALTSTPNPSTFGEAVELSATLYPLSATGIVSFYDQNGGLGDVAVQGGVATLKLSTLPTGTDSLKALYNGDATYPKNLSPVYTQTVNKVSTFTGLTSSPDPSQTGQTVTFTATVTPKTAQGEVKFYVDSALLSTVKLARGTASASNSTLSPGTHSVTAIYYGNNNFDHSVSPVRIQTVKAAASVE
jgi:hypothetical protein